MEATGEDMVTIGAVGGVLHLSPEYPTIVGGGSGGGKRAGGGGRGFFLSEPSSPVPEEGDMAMRDGGGASSSSSQAAAAAAAERAGLRLIEDRTGRLSSASAAPWSYRARQAADALGQEALAVLVLLLGGAVILLLMRWRRRGPWSPRMPR